jgi:putative transposase
LLTDSEFNSWCDQLGLSSAAIEIIRHIRRSPPSRRVGGGPENVSGYYPSRKMGVTIQFDSHTVEFPLIYQMEHDDDVLEYYCQPWPIRLKYAGPSGRRVVAWHTPDYFVLRHDRAGWVEAKSEEDLPLLARKSPNRYRLVENRWECPAGRVYAEPLSLCYDVHSSADISPIFFRNAQFLDDYLRAPDPVPAASIDAVFDCLAKNSAITLDELLAQTKQTATPDAIYQMIATSIIHIDLSGAPLVEPEQVRVFRDSETAVQFHAATKDDRPDIGIVDICSGTTLSWDGKPWTVVNVGSNNVALLGENKSFVELPLQNMESLLQEGRLLRIGGRERAREHSEVQLRLVAASESDLKAANRRKTLVDAYLNSEVPAKSLNRTMQRHVSQYLKAQEAYGNGYIGLIPRTGRRGNRHPKLPEEARLAMTKFIKEEYETLEQPTRFSSWSTFKDRRELENLASPSYRSFCTAVDARPRYEQTKERKGRRAAYKHKEFYWNLDQQTPRHGDRPFEIAHIDHTELDLEMIFPETGKNLGRLWLTIMTDAFSRRTLAKYLSFDEPSYRSCMMVIRECVRRHGRLPQIIVVDGGREFASTYFDQVLARYEVTKKTRPPAQARFGSVCERMFGTTNTQFLHNLHGNTQIMKNVRQVTKSNNPKGRAIWDFESLDDRLTEFLYEVYDTIQHPALGQSPRDAFNAGLDISGARLHRYILYDTAFLMATAPSTRKGTSKVQPGRGVTINYFSYWAQAFRDPQVENRNVPVRYDPYNMGIAWAFVRGRWVECHSQFYSELKGRSEREVKIAARKLLQQMSQYSQNRITITASKLASFLRNVKQDEELLMQRLCDQESRHARERSDDNEIEETHDVSDPPETGVVDHPMSKKSFRDVEIYGAL